MIRYWLNGLFIFILSMSTALQGMASVPIQTGGAMLYDNHCIQCRTRQLHWREKRMATDSESLTSQVDRWQHASALPTVRDSLIITIR